MSWRGKRKYNGPAFNEHSEASKKANTTDDSNDSDDVVICEVSKNRRVSVRNWQGKIWIDIREFYVKDGKQLPGKKGISLSLEQWNTIREHAGEIKQALRF